VCKCKAIVASKSRLLRAGNDVSISRIRIRMNYTAWSCSGADCWRSLEMEYGCEPGELHSGFRMLYLPTNVELVDHNKHYPYPYPCVVLYLDMDAVVNVGVVGSTPKKSMLGTWRCAAILQ
jgi:hypothetical protein